MEEYNRQELEQKMKTSPRSTIFAHLAYSLIEENEFERALAICQSNIVNHKKYGFGHFVLGLCHFELGNEEEALNEFEVATFIDPSNFRAWKLLKQLYKNKGISEKETVADNFIKIWEKDETAPLSEGEEFATGDFIDDIDFGADEKVLDDDFNLTAPPSSKETTNENETNDSIDDIGGFSFDEELGIDGGSEDADDLQDLNIAEQPSQGSKESSLDSLQDLDFDENPNELIEENSIGDLEEISFDEDTKSSTSNEDNEELTELSFDDETFLEDEKNEEQQVETVEKQNSTLEESDSLENENDELDELEMDNFNLDDEDDEEDEQSKSVQDEILDNFSDLDDIDIEDSLESEDSFEKIEEEQNTQNKLNEESDELTDIESLKDLTDLENEDLSGSLLDEIQESGDQYKSEEKPVVEEEKFEDTPEISKEVSDMDLEIPEMPVENLEKAELIEAQPKTLTSTLGEIYISQGKFKEALNVFEELAKNKPNSKRFARKVNELKELIQTQSM